MSIIKTVKIPRICIAHRFLPILVFFLGLSAAFAGGQPWTGKVVGISDGDTLKVLNGTSPEVIRLYGIDAPEKKQPFGEKARQFTAEIAFAKTVEVRPVNKDRYGRTVGWVFVNGKNLNAELLDAGFAWHFKRYSPDPDLALREESARRRKCGLWSHPNPVPPWKFRQTASVARKTPAAAKSPKIVTRSGGYRANPETMKFHGPGCRHYDAPSSSIRFAGRKEAIKAGYTPCAICRPLK